MLECLISLLSFQDETSNELLRLAQEYVHEWCGRAPSLAFQLLQKISILEQRFASIDPDQIQPEKTLKTGITSELLKLKKEKLSLLIKQSNYCIVVLASTYKLKSQELISLCDKLKDASFCEATHFYYLYAILLNFFESKTSLTFQKKYSLIDIFL
jgi:hypothetical protein